MAYRWTSPVITRIEAAKKKQEEELRRKLEEETKPCPFCGLKPQVTKPGLLWSIGCQTIGCFCNIGTTPLFKTKQEAIDKWNKRLGEELGINKQEERQ